MTVASAFVGVALLVMAAVAQQTPSFFNYSDVATHSDAFVDTLCFCTHLHYSNTPYSNLSAVTSALTGLGVRHIRDGGDDPTTIAGIKSLATHGITTTYVMVPMGGVGPDPSATYGTIFIAAAPVAYTVTEFLASIVPGAVDAIEIMNEEDLFWNYNGGTQWFANGTMVNNNASSPWFWANYTSAVTCATYEAIKGNATVSHVAVIGPSLGAPYGYNDKPITILGNLSTCVDFGNMHSYPFGGNSYSVPFAYDSIDKYYWTGDFPTVNIDAFPFGFDIFEPTFAPKPMVATETGYWTSNQGAGISEYTHAKYMPRLFLEYFRKGVQRTCSYELIDEFNDTGMQSNFGVVRYNLTVKPAYTALQGLIALLTDAGTLAAPGSIAWNLTVTPYTGGEHTEFVHHVLLQKANGSFYLPIWHEIANADTASTPTRDIFPAPQPSIISLPPNLVVSVVYWTEPTAGFTLQSKAALHVAGTPFALDVQDYVTVLQIDTA